MTETPRLSIEAASALALGARERQEDALAVAFHGDASDGFAVLSDGMGGHKAGDVASRIVVTQIFAELTLFGATKDSQDAEICARLRDAVRRANETIGAHAVKYPRVADLGATVLATTISNGRLHWISVGDSPLYLFRDLTLTRLNQDHSMAPQIDLMAERGMLTPREAQSHPNRNTLTSALIGFDIDAIDCPEKAFPLTHGDVVLLASDGLQYLPDPIIEAVLIKTRGQSSSRVARALMRAIDTLKDPNQDNTSLVVTRVTRARATENPLLGWLSRQQLNWFWSHMQTPTGKPATQNGEAWTAH